MPRKTSGHYCVRAGTGEEEPRRLRHTLYILQIAKMFVGNLANWLAAEGKMQEKKEKKVAERASEVRPDSVNSFQI